MLRIKILSLQVSLWLVTNKELGRLVLTQEILSSALRQLALVSQGKKFRTMIRCPSSPQCLPSNHSLRLLTLLLWLPKSLLWKVPFKSSLFCETSPDHSNLRLCSSELPDPFLPVWVDPHTVYHLTMLSLQFSGTLKEKSIVYLFLSPLLDSRGRQVHWFGLPWKGGPTDPGCGQIPEEPAGLEPFVHKPVEVRR